MTYHDDSTLSAALLEQLTTSGMDALLQDSHGMAVRRRSPLTEEKLAERAEELSANLRANLTQEVRNRLRQTAEDILRFLQQSQDADSPEVSPALLSQHNRVDPKTSLASDKRKDSDNVAPQGDLLKREKAV